MTGVTWHQSQMRLAFSRCWRLPRCGTLSLLRFPLGTLLLLRPLFWSLGLFSGRATVKTRSGPTPCKPRACKLHPTSFATTNTFVSVHLEQYDVISVVIERRKLPHLQMPDHVCRPTGASGHAGACPMLVGRSEYPCMAFVMTL